MKIIRIIIAALLVAVSCTRITPEEIKYLNLSRCLQPTSLSAEVENDTEVTFSWQINKDAGSYLLVFADNPEFEPATDTTLTLLQVPFTISLESGKEYYYKVQALSEERAPSKWAFCEEPAQTK